MKIFLIKKNNYQNIVVVRENGFVFYEARNKGLYPAIQECLAYMSSFTDVAVYLDGELDSYYKGEKIGGKNGEDN